MSVHWTNVGTDEEGNPLEVDGAVWMPYEMIKWIVDKLYAACKITMTAFKILAEFIQIILPSKLVLDLWDGTTVPDFTLPEKRFWYMSLKMGSLEMVKIPLPKEDLWSIWKILVMPINTPISGSENYKYLCEDGEVRYGRDCDPVRYYGPLTEGLMDVGSVILIGGIIYILFKIGIFETALEFVKSVYLKIRTKKIAKGVDETQTMVSFMSSIVEKSKLQEADFVEFREYLESIPEIKNCVGLRMALR